MKLLRLLNNLLLVYLLYMLCRVVYVMEFWDLYSAGWSQLSLGSLIAGGLRFDTSAIIYTNLLYILLVLVPLPRRWTTTKGYQLALKILFVVVNALMLVINLIDTVYSRYTGRRTTWTFFSEFQNEGNLGSIFGIELLNHWYLVLIGIAFMAPPQPYAPSPSAMPTNTSTSRPKPPSCSTPPSLSSAPWARPPLPTPDTSTPHSSTPSTPPSTTRNPSTLPATQAITQTRIQTFNPMWLSSSSRVSARNT